jgi:hypothetical protein
MAQVEFELAISREEYLRHYQSQGRLQVVVTALDGRRVRFPAGILQPFVLHEGVHGRFVIQFDSQGRLCSIDRVV